MVIDRRIRSIVTLQGWSVINQWLDTTTGLAERLIRSVQCVTAALLTSSTYDRHHAAGRIVNADRCTLHFVDTIGSLLFKVLQIGIDRLLQRFLLLQINRRINTVSFVQQFLLRIRICRVIVILIGFLLFSRIKTVLKFKSIFFHNLLCRAIRHEGLDIISFNRLRNIELDFLLHRHVIFFLRDDLVI